MSDIAELLTTDENGSFPQKIGNSSLEKPSDEILANHEVANPSDEISANSSDEAPAKADDELIAGFLSLALVKDYCRIIGDAENELLKLLIASARDEFESYTQRSLDEFGANVPANVIKWGLAVVADGFENRGIYKKDLFFAINRYRKSPLRIEAAQEAAQPKEK